jgi:hypothetical protein
VKKSEKLVKQIEFALAELESQGKAGDAASKDQHERLLAVISTKYQDTLWERAKIGKGYRGFDSIWELLGIADNTIDRLFWLAKNRSKDCEGLAETRLNWPAYISLLPDIERNCQKLKKHIPLGRKFSHYSKRTKVDTLFGIARFVIRYLSESHDSFSGIYFAPFIKGIEWMKNPERDEAIKKYCAECGAMTRKNWPRWKPIFERVITLYYGPSRERWKFIPNTPVPKKLGSEESNHKSKRPDLTPKSLKDNLHIAEIFGTTIEWHEQFGKRMSLTAAEKAELENDLKRLAAECRRRCVMDMERDKALEKIHEREERRDGGWGDFKSAILRKCFNLLPRS